LSGRALSRHAPARTKNPRSEMQNRRGRAVPLPLTGFSKSHINCSGLPPSAQVSGSAGGQPSNPDGCDQVRRLLQQDRRFGSPGTHVKVRCRLVGLPYWHHRIYVHSSEVIEFGGGDLWNKGQTQIRRVPVTGRAKGGTVEVVAHPITWCGLTCSPMRRPAQVIDRAGWLLWNQPPPYRLGYRNCYSIGVWCATGDFESFQVKWFMRGRAFNAIDNCFADEEAVHRHATHVARVCSIAGDSRSLRTQLGLLSPYR
jgi:hypothetical protein